MPFYTNVNGVIKELKALDSYSSGSYKHPYVYKTSVNGVTTDLVNLINAENIVDFINIDFYNIKLFKTTSRTDIMQNADVEITSNKDAYYSLEVNDNSYTVSILANKNVFVILLGNIYVNFKDGHKEQLVSIGDYKTIFNSFKVLVSYSHNMGNDSWEFYYPNILGNSLTPDEIGEDVETRTITNFKINLTENDFSNITLNMDDYFAVYSSSTKAYRTYTYDSFIVNNVNIPIKITNSIS